MKPKLTKTADAWRERVLALRASGQSVRGWCKTHGCHEHAFYWWRAKLGLVKLFGRSYNERRRHSSLGYLTPGEFAAKWTTERAGTFPAGVKVS